MYQRESDGITENVIKLYTNKLQIEQEKELISKISPIRNKNISNPCPTQVNG